MRTSVSPSSTRPSWEATSAPGEVQVRLGARYHGQLGFRRLLLAETLIALVQQQLPASTWRLRSATLKFTGQPTPDPASIVTVHRSVFAGSMLANLRLIQHGRLLATCVGAFEREWRPALATAAPPPILGAPDQLPPLQNWPEDAENECRDASGRLRPDSERQVLGGFVRHHLAPRNFSAEHVPTFLEPWVSMPSPEGSGRLVDAIVIELHTPAPPSELVQVASAG